jgi:NitT/TauT family transport system substrate-binding protein
MPPIPNKNDEHDNVPTTGRGKMQRFVILKGLLALASLVLAGSSGFAQDTLKLAIGQRGLWETSLSELGQSAGIFKKHGLTLETLYTQGTGETQQIVISGSVDIGISVGTFGALGGFSKGAPIRVIGATMTGANDLLWYVPASSPIKTISDTAGKTVAYSTSGSSTQQTVLAFAKHFAVDLKPVATGGPPSTFTQVMSGQIDVGWTVLPFALDALEQGKIRIIGKGNDIPYFRDQTIRIVLANADKLKSRRDLFVRYMRAYRETLDWMYSDPAALTAYAQWAKIPEAMAPRVRAMLPKEDLNPDQLSGLDGLMSDAVTFKYMAAPLSKDQLSELFQMPFK